jgi:hypothetical protein
MHKGAAHFADAIILGSETLDGAVEYLTASNKPVQPWLPPETIFPALLEFFRTITATEVPR